MFIDSEWTHLKEISNTKLLVSIHSDWANAANMEIFDISKKGQANKIYPFEEVSGGKIDLKLLLIFITLIIIFPLGNWPWIRGL